MSKELDETKDPGSAKYGNFINYYQFHPPIERISVFPPNLMNIISIYKSSCNVNCLDIGSNTGDLTHAVYNHLCQNKPDDVNLNILGIDLDKILIERASLFPNPNVTFKVIDFMDPNDYQEVKNYISLLGVEKLNIVFCFSVTMWIHLNYGDDGLKQFLIHMTEISNFILIEPQPWKCYISAARRMRKLKQKEFNNLDHLTLRSNIVDFIIMYLQNNCNMELIYESGKTKWGRKLFLLKSNSLKKI